ncbi:MAG: hypothetical protein WCL53_05700, partial [Chloroflexota bacterium]
MIVYVPPLRGLPCATGAVSGSVSTPVCEVTDLLPVSPPALPPRVLAAPAAEERRACDAERSHPHAGDHPAAGDGRSE